MKIFMEAEENLEKPNSLQGRVFKYIFHPKVALIICSVSLANILFSDWTLAPHVITILAATFYLGARWGYIQVPVKDKICVDRWVWYSLTPNPKRNTWLEENTNNADIDLVNKIIDSLVILTRVSRHAGFRFVYFGKEESYRDNVRFLIRERILGYEREYHIIDDDEIESIVDRFIKRSRPAKLFNDGREDLMAHSPKAWGRISG